MKPSEIIDSHISIVDLLEYYGVPMRHNRFPCPVHNGKDFNATIGSNPKVFTCFVCNKSFNSITLVMERENCDFNRAVELIGEWFHIDELTRELTPEERRLWAAAKEQRRIEREKELERQAADFKAKSPEYRRKANEYIKSLTKTERSHAYLAIRGIKKNLAIKYGVRDCEIWTGERNEPAIMIPYSRVEDEVWSWRRSIESKQFRKTKGEYLGDEPVFNYIELNTGLMLKKKIFITESPLDSISAEQLYGTDGVVYVSIGGTAINKLWKAIGDNKPAKIICGFDNDAVGHTSAKELEAECKRRKIPYQRFVFDADCKDINDYLRKKLQTDGK